MSTAREEAAVVLDDEGPPEGKVRVPDDTSPAQAGEEDDGILVTLDHDDERTDEIDDTRTAEDIQAEFESGMLSAEDFVKPSASLPDEVPIDDPEPRSTPEPTGPEVELLLTADEAFRLMDELIPSGAWRNWPGPPGIPVHGKGWSGVWFSEHELRRWASNRRS